MDSTLSRYLKTLHTPSGAPLSGVVEWDRVDLFGAGTRIKVEWGEDRLEINGESETASWKVLAKKSNEGWDLEEATPCVGGGTLLAKVRWAGRQVEEVAQGATPKTDWDVVAKPRGRGMTR